MAANRLDAGKQGADAAKNGAGDKDAAAKSGGGAKAWLPLVATIVAMPLLAYATTTFILVPKLKSSLGSAAAHEESGEEAHGEAAGDAHGGGSPAGGSHGAKDAAAGSDKAKYIIPIREKLLVNVAGTAGTRFLVVNFSMRSSNPKLRTLLEENEAQIRDLGSSILATKSITDLEKPGARNLIRTELITVLNNSLGNNYIQDIYFTEFAVQ